MTHPNSQPDTSAAMDDMRDPEVAAAMRNEEAMVSTTQPVSDALGQIDAGHWAVGSWFGGDFCEDPRATKAVAEALRAHTRCGVQTNDEAHEKEITRLATIAECANIADAVDSGRGNEKQIAMSIRALASMVPSAEPSPVKSRIDREGGWNAERSLSVPSTDRP